MSNSNIITNITDQISALLESSCASIDKRNLILCQIKQYEPNNKSLYEYYNLLYQECIMPYTSKVNYVPTEIILENDFDIDRLPEYWYMDRNLKQT